MKRVIITGLILSVSLFICATEWRKEYLSVLDGKTKAPHLSIADLVSIVLETKQVPVELKKFSDGKIYIFLLEGTLRSVLIPGERYEFRTDGFSTGDLKFAMYFRELEVEILRQLGTPVYSYKNSIFDGTKIDMHYLGKGVVKYVTVWKKGPVNLTLKMTGKNYKIYIQLEWNNR